MARLSSDFDTSWKEALREFLPEAVAFFFPDVHAEIDWVRGFQFLDLELRQAVRRAARTSKRLRRGATRECVWSGSCAWYACCTSAATKRKGSASFSAPWS